MCSTLINRGVFTLPEGSEWRYIQYIYQQRGPYAHRGFRVEVKYINYQCGLYTSIGGNAEGTVYLLIKGFYAIRGAVHLFTEEFLCSQMVQIKGKYSTVENGGTYKQYIY